MTQNLDIIPKDLRDSLESEEFEEMGGGLLIDSIVFNGDDIEILFTIKYSSDTVSEQRWKILVKNSATEIVTRNWAEYLEIFDDHFLLYEFHDNYVEIYFNNKASDPFKLLGDLVELHKFNFGDMLPFGFGLNTPTGWHDLCSTKNGLFARGPKRIIELYEKCLNKNGISTSLINEIHLDKKRRKLLLFGDSYFVGETFSFERL